ncbi:TetR/AcrR family transcriptional regulator [Colwellia sp. MB3u-70]|uniref:TetR/AcrR family transcriptional regulator n=1 Tax=unclassified Colwellia TaxID=196834 RepID=UPI0015F3E122|nr:MULTISPECIES: TetR/AcrR family transcriptional regulator [unclassified Colwellia]MBA6293067.1 TetR/AcrR family transcriptional regulator [Colwellia sp. MB3u-8]MBA6306612.1 TetR/AcrR family transcriptional regulator [Colwellia sp. MB3u-70]
MVSGRKRKFNEQTALQAAMEVFWAKGFVGASLADLTKSMNINKPSMYSAFGNKESLFIKATQHYIENNMKAHLGALSAVNIPLKTRLKNYMMSILAMQCSTEQPKGCYLVLCQSEVAGGDIPAEAAKLLIDIEAAPKALLAELFSTDEEAISLGLNENSAGNALSLYTALKGTASMARSKIPPTELEFVIDTILTGVFSTGKNHTVPSPKLP